MKINYLDLFSGVGGFRMSDTQLYKMAGNAVSSPVEKCIAERLLSQPEDFLEVQG